MKLVGAFVAAVEAEVFRAAGICLLYAVQEVPDDATSLSRDVVQSIRRQLREEERQDILSPADLF